MQVKVINFISKSTIASSVEAVESKRTVNLVTFTSGNSWNDQLIVLTYGREATLSRTITFRFCLVKASSSDVP